MMHTNNPYRGTRILVTGASGFIGKYLATELFNLGAKVSALDLTAKGIPSGVAIHIGDLSDASFVESCLTTVQPEVIFHLAAYKERSVTLESFRTALSVNLDATLNLIISAKRLSGFQRLVVMGTVEEYGHIMAPFVEGTREAPVSAYSFSKLCMTHLCETLNDLFRFPFVALRPTVAYGPGQGPEMFVPALIQSLLKGDNFPMTAGKQTRDFIYITDLVRAILQAGACNQARGQVINVGSGEPVTIAHLATMLEEMIGSGARAEAGALAYRKGEIMDYSIDLGKARAILNWQAEVSLQVGLRQTIEYYRENASA